MSNVTPFLPAVASQMITDDQVSLLRLSDLLKAIFIDHEVQGDDLYVTDGLEFPVWISVLQEPKLVLFVTYFTPEDEMPSDWLTRVNEFNSTIMVPQFAYQEGSVWGNYWMTFDGGLSVRHFVKMLRRFSSAFRKATKDWVPSPKADAGGEAA